MIRPILMYGNEILKTQSVEVDFNDPELPEILNDMYDTMKSSVFGIGLAAPQIGINKRIFVIEIDEYGEGIGGTYINPKILRQGGYFLQIEESCLSLPNIWLSVKRSTIVELEWYDENKQYHKEFFIDYQARVIQHEVDILDGILITDRADPIEISKISVQLENLMKSQKNESL